MLLKENQNYQKRHFYGSLTVEYQEKYLQVL